MEEEETSESGDVELQDWELIPKSEALSSTQAFGTLAEIQSDYVGVLKSDHLSLGFLTDDEEISAEFTEPGRNLSRFSNWIDPLPLFRMKSGDFFWKSNSDFSEIPSTVMNSVYVENLGKFSGVLGFVESGDGLNENIGRGIGNYTEECGDLEGSGCFNGVEKNKSMVRWKYEDFGSNLSKYPLDNGFIGESSEKTDRIREFLEVLDNDHCKNRWLDNVGYEEITAGDVDEDFGLRIGNNAKKSGHLVNDENNAVTGKTMEKKGVESIPSNGEIGGGICNSSMESGDLAENACFNGFFHKLSGIGDTGEEEKKKGEELMESNGEIDGGIGKKSMESCDLAENGCFDGIFGKLSGMEGDTREKKNKTIEWWKFPFEFVKLCVARVGPIWVFSAAVAVVGFIFLKRKFYKVKEKRKALELNVTMDDNKQQVSHLVNRAAQINDAFSLAKRAGFFGPVSAPALHLFPTGMF